ncbi:2-oxoacid:ferredoxin oxidoreductase, alpha subunit [Candidatus Methanoperedens nitroreducens]|uniref:2-oxoglutarate synthase subunit KorA n=1 Tax=Candidatus Methanoperedens nitratireducens TaxID=1392998 RepID=A0A062V267_9EURY|nr:2-oxoacid:acceptor oxidoreductase subunit alpha [Candidatus Methanoperedens nitroreducens]KCZ73211.1 2-oxoacid:ferredoxin oxidoreductase, alpha subunit [Candidatus Methanoperedens nitroreducens]MDJ1422840.1 2-oxoacid:acceptor oxidoreductase subunit alpha [Candidatus Methanoperedens sp.]
MKKRNDVLLQGNEACALGALAAGMRFYAGYPITPSTEIAELLSIELPKVGGIFIQMEDEIASIAAIIGASLAGAKSMTATSGPGFSLMQENLGFAAMAEVPCVVVNVMRGGPSTGMPTRASQGDVMQSRWGTHGDHPAIVLSPGSVLECYTLTVHAFNLSEKYRTPVIVLMDGIMGHMSENIKIPEKLEIINRPKPTVPPIWYRPYDDIPGGEIVPLVPFGEGYRYHVTGLVHDALGFPTLVPDEVNACLKKIIYKIKNNLHDIIRIEKYLLDDADICIVAYGSVARSAREAVNMARQEGIKAGMLRPITLWPFPRFNLEDIGRKVKVFVVPEMNYGQVYGEVLKACHKKVVRVTRVDGELITPDEIMKKIKEVTI